MGLPIRSNGSAAPYATSMVIKGTSKGDQGGIKETTNNRGRASHGADGVLMGIPMSDRSKIDRYLPWSLIAPRTQISKEEAPLRPARRACTVKYLSGGCVLYELDRFSLNPRSTPKDRPQ
jgi:hypothetical protein